MDVQTSPWYLAYDSAAGSVHQTRAQSHFGRQDIEYRDRNLSQLAWPRPGEAGAVEIDRNAGYGIVGSRTRGRQRQEQSARTHGTRCRARGALIWREGNPLGAIATYLERGIAPICVQVSDRRTGPSWGQTGQRQQSRLGYNSGCVPATVLPRRDILISILGEAQGVSR